MFLLITTGLQMFHYQIKFIVLKLDFVLIQERQMTKAPAIPAAVYRHSQAKQRLLEVGNKRFPELPLEPVSVFTHYSQMQKGLGIMCKYSTRWLLQHPIVAGHPHAPLLAVRSLQVTGIWPDIPTSRGSTHRSKPRSPVFNLAPTSTLPINLTEGE